MEEKKEKKQCESGKKEKEVRNPNDGSDPECFAFVVHRR